jgi:hypothetical protein
MFEVWRVVFYLLIGGLAWAKDGPEYAIGLIGILLIFHSIWHFWPSTYDENGLIENEYVEPGLIRRFVEKVFDILGLVLGWLFLIGMSLGIIIGFLDFLSSCGRASSNIGEQEYRAR